MDATAPYANEPEELAPPVQSCALRFFQYLACSNTTSGTADLPPIHRYKYNASIVETRLIKSSGTCTRSACRPASDVIAVAKHFLKNPHHFGAFIPESRNSEHFAVFCSTTEQSIKDLASGEEPKIGSFTTTADAYVTAAQAASTKGRVAMVAGATCGVLAAGTLWGLAPAVALGSAVYATTKYVANRGTVKAEEKRKKDD